jgi:cell division protease FtsH
MGGRLAEELQFSEVTTGASNDLENATRMARQMVTRYGMSQKLGPRTFGRREELVFLGKEIVEQRDYSDKIAEEIDEEVHLLIDEAYRRAKEILEAHRLKLIQIARHLMQHETVEGEELNTLFDSPPPTEEELARPLEPTPTPAEPRQPAPVSAPKAAPEPPPRPAGQQGPAPAPAS